MGGLIAAGICAAIFFLLVILYLRHTNALLTTENKWLTIQMGIKDARIEELEGEKQPPEEEPRKRKHDPFAQLLHEERLKEVMRLRDRCLTLQTQCDNLQKRLAQYSNARFDRDSYRDEFHKLQHDYATLSENHTRILKSLSFTLPAFDWQDRDDVSRLYNALRDNLEAECKDITATFESRSPRSNGDRYKTSLIDCDCYDFRHRAGNKKPCKHMFALALRMNAELSPLKGVDRQMILEYTDLKSAVVKEKREIKKIVSTTSQRSPWLAKRIAEYYDQIDRERIASIPRSTKKEELDRLRREKKQLLIERNELQSQLDYLIQTFPEIRISMSEPPNI